MGLFGKKNYAPFVEGQLRAWFDLKLLKTFICAKNVGKRFPWMIPCYHFNLLMTSKSIWLIGRLTFKVFEILPYHAK